MLKYIKFVHPGFRKSIYGLAILALHSVGQNLVMAQNATAPEASSADISSLQVNSSMVLVEDVGPVGIGNDHAALTLHSVDTFFMDAYEVSKALWDEVRTWGVDNGYSDLPEGRAGEKGDSTHPVSEVSWYDAVKWCNARSEMDGLRPAYYLDDAFTRVFRNREEITLHVDHSSGYRLPTELEWEKAARGDQYANDEKTEGFDYPWGSNEKTPEDANYAPGVGNTTPVGSYPPNPYGLYDMSGNIWEMCWDPAPNRSDDQTLFYRVMRGGSWLNSGYGEVFYTNINAKVTDRYSFFGFRTVLPPLQTAPPVEPQEIRLSYLSPSHGQPFYRLVWESSIGSSYWVEQVDALGSDWTPATTQPIMADSETTEWTFEADGSARFFRVRSAEATGGTTTRVELTSFPEDGAFGIPQLALISLDLPDPEAITTSTIRISIGSLGNFGVDDAALTFDQGTLTFDPSLAGALGEPEALVAANVFYNDQEGNQYTYDWSFRIQKQTILSGDVFVLGSPQAQFQGQALNARQLAIYEDLGVTPSAFAIRQQTGNAPWSLDEVKDDSLVFSYEGDTPPNFQVGQYLANLTPARKDEIFYRKVAVVLKDVPEDQMVTVFTEDVGLLEIFVQASMLSHPVGLPAAAYAIAQEGFLVNASQGYLLESPIEETWSPQEGVDLTLSGNISIEPRLSLSLDIQGSTVEDFYLRQEGKMITELGASLKVSESHQWETATEDPIFSADRVFYLGQVGVVPIWLDLEFEVNAEAEASYEAAGEISTGIQKTYDYWSELVYSERNPSLNGMFSSPPSTELEVKPLEITVDGHAKAAVRLVPELTMELESLFGVRVDLTPEVGLEGDVSFVNGEMESASVELYGRLDLNAGLSIEGIEDDLLPEMEPIELVYFPWRFEYEEPSVSIVTQPQSQSVVAGSKVELSVEVSNDTGIQYQWYHNGEPILGENDSSLVIDEFDADLDEGIYFVSLKKGDKTVLSNEATISSIIEKAPLQFVEAPGAFFNSEPAFLNEGSDADLVVLTNDPDNPEVSFEWSQDDVLLPETGNVLELNNVSSVHEGLYRVRAIRGTNEAITMFQVKVLNDFKLIEVLPGSFTMGSSRHGNTKPLTDVTITQKYWLGETEVTQAQWVAVMFTNPSLEEGENLPVSRVTWTRAMDFCKKLTENQRATGLIPEGYEYSLPTEAQWEYACRAGTTTMFWFGDWDERLVIQNYESVSEDTPQPVRSKAANPWGFFDMLGSTQELCRDWYAANHPGGSVTDPLGPETGEERVMRGGWYGASRIDQIFFSSAFRGSGTSGGFRVALVPVSPQ